MEIHPFDRREPVIVSAGLLYSLICNASIATGAFDGSDEARTATIMAATVSIPQAKRALIDQANWLPYEW